MLGKQSDLDGGEHAYLDHVGRDSFYGFLASHRTELFHDEDFTDLYCSDNGRPSVPPSLLATALLLQAYEGASDEEAKARADFDLRWKVALGIGLEEKPFAKSTLQLFRARLILHERVRAILQRSLAFARRTGYFRSRKLKVVLDTTYVLDRGAVKDTYNLLADGIVSLARTLAAGIHSDPEEWAREHHLGRYFGSSVKGEAGIDWDDPEARQVFFEGVVVDADRVLMVAPETMEKLPASDPKRGRLHDGAVLLERLLLQDIERREEGTTLKQGVSPDRVVSVHDPEMRHGRKSGRRRFDGHKAHLAVDPESQPITAADVLAGNAADHERALRLVEQAEANAGVMVEEVVGDCALRGRQHPPGIRRCRAETCGEDVQQARGRPVSQRGLPDRPGGYELRLPCQPTNSEGGVDQFGRSLRSSGRPFAGVSLRCRHLRWMSVAAQVRAGAPRKRSFGHDPPAGSLAAGGKNLPAQRGFAPYRKLRQVAEHRLARLMQLGVRQARYFGRTKTLFQLLMAATLANLTLVATKTGLMGDRNHPKRTISIHIRRTRRASLIAICTLFSARFTG